MKPNEETVDSMATNFIRENVQKLDKTML